MPDWLSDDGATLMAVVNVNPDSFSDPRDGVSDTERVEAALAAVAAGAAVVDLGAQSAALAAAVVPAAEQIARLVPVVSALAGRGLTVSVDTYDGTVAAAVLAAGATILNDYSGGIDPGLVAAVAASDAWYVLTHNPLGPRRRQTDPGHYRDVVADTVAWLERRLGELSRCGIDPERVLLDPGVDVSKTPRQSLDLLRGLPAVRAALPHPQLVAISRKDVLGVLTGRAPAERDAATLALLAHVADQPRTLVRVHDVAACRDFLRVRRALAGELDLAPDAVLDDRLRREP